MNNHTENLHRTHGLAFSVETIRYHRDLTDAFEKKFGDERIRFTTSHFDNGMPLNLVGSADHVLLLTWMPEDSFSEAFANMILGGAGFTENPDEAGSNAKRLGIFAPFFDARMEKRGRKDMPDGKGRAIIKSQVATVPPLARAMRYVAGAEYLATLDLHSYQAAQICESYGLSVINLTSARLFAETIKNNPDYNSQRRRVVVTTDAGNFNRAIPFQKHLEADLAVALKVREPEGEGKKNKVKAQLVHGSVKDADVYILDDSISGGSTTLEALSICQDAASITYCATHPVFVDDYYAKLEAALDDKRVNRIIVTDSLPTKYRLNEASLPYTQNLNGSFKDIEIVHVGDFLANSAYTILHANSVQEAKQNLGDDVWEMQNPDTLYKQTTGQPSSTLPDTGVYLERKKFITLFEYNKAK